MTENSGRGENQALRENARNADPEETRSYRTGKSGKRTQRRCVWVNRAESIHKPVEDT